MSVFKDLLTGLRDGFLEFGESIGTIINSLLLSIVYIIGVGVTSIFAKIFKKHFLDLKINKKQSSYWDNLDLKEKKIEKYYRTF